MKQILLFTLLTLSATKAYGEAPSLREHMRAMGYMLDEINARADDFPRYHEAAAKTRELRVELVQSISLEPGKFANLSGKELNAARIEYHQLLSRVIYLAATLEKTLDAEDDGQTQSGTRMTDVRNILHEINVLVGKAHRKFRD